MYYCIANPSARSGNSGEEVSRLTLLLDAEKIPYELCYTKGPGDAQRYGKEISEKAKESGEIATIVVFGGDGTINEVLSGIVDFSVIHFAIVPVGSGNDMARGLKLPEDNHRLYARIAEGKVLRTIDLGRIHYDKRTNILSRLHPEVIEDDHLFGVSMGVGFDAAVCEEVLASGAKSFLNKLHLGSLTYGLVAVKQLVALRKASCDLETDDGTKLHFNRIIFVSALNLAYQGGGYEFAPDAVADDGLLNVVVIGDLMKLRALMAFPSAKKGKCYGIKGVTHFKCKKLTIRTGEPLWVHTDGEVSMKSDAVTVSVLPQRLQLIV